jgi:hypothetical protein
MEYYDVKENAGEVLLQTLAEVGIISESKAKILNAKTTIILENKGNTPSVYSFNYKGQDFSVTWNDFWSVYSDLQNYKSYKDMLIALGIPKDVIADAYNKWDSDKMKAMINHFGKTYGNNHIIPKSLDRSNGGEPGRNDFYNLGYRNLSDVPTIIEGGKIQLDLDAIADFAGIDSVDEFVSGIRIENPDKDSVIYGTRSKDSSRTGRTIEAINKQELFPGEFYSNMSRIPRSSLFNWLRIWKKDTVGLKAEKQSKWDLGLGRRWKKIFIMGYQVNDRFLYEVWFNTIDSTYTLHDHRGGELSKRSATLAEVMRYLYLQLAKTSPKDVEFLQNPFDKTTLDSFVRSMSTDIDQRTDDMLARERAEQEKIIKAIEDKEKKREAFKKNIGQMTSKFSNVTDEVFGKPYQRREMGEMGETPVVIGSDVKRLSKEMKELYQQRIRMAHTSMDMRKEKIEETKRKIIDLYNKIKEKLNDSYKRGELQEKDFRKATQEIDQQYGKINSDISKEIRSLSQAQYNKQMAVNENFGEEPFSDIARERMMADEFANEVSETAFGTAYNNRVSTIRTQADRDSINFKKLQDMLMTTIVKYTDESRIGMYATTRFDKMLNVARKDKVVYPTDKPSILNRIKNFVSGTRYRADFIAGYSLADRVDFEIWYVTEPNPNYNEKTDRVKLVSSFYVYDLSSAKLIRKFIPYYRNAEQVILQKIGTIGR